MKHPPLRRGALGLAVALLGACVGAPPADEPPAGIPPVVTRELGDLRVHVVNTGWVRVKRAHRDLGGPVALRVPAILLDRHWTAFMPVLVGVIEHPEGVFLVDSGLSEATLDPGHFACDAVTAFVYRNLLDFRFAPDQRIDRRLAALGIDAARVKGVVVTHRHADHADGLDVLPPAAAIYVGAADWPSHDGALACRWPSGRAPVLVRDEGPPLAAFPHSFPLTADGRVAIVPLTGHSPGHLGVLVRAPGSDVVFAGDAAFDLEQIAARRLAGIVEVPERARASLDVLAAQLAAFPTSLLPAHDPASLARFAQGVETPDPARFSAAARGQETVRSR